MKRVLLDTHAYLWFVFDDPRLSPKAAETIQSQRVTKLLSMASLWEIVIKTQIGKLTLGLPLPEFFDRYVTQRDLEVVDIELGHLLVYHALPLKHRDPFDRLLVAQARGLKAPIVTSDPSFSQYDVRIVW